MGSCRTRSGGSGSSSAARSTSTIGDQKEIYHPNPTGHTELANCLHPYGSFGTAGARTGGDVDVVFVIDTTGSMFDDIAAVKSFATQSVDLLQDRPRATASRWSPIATGRGRRATRATIRPVSISASPTQALDHVGDQRDVRQRRRRLSRIGLLGAYERHRPGLAPGRAEGRDPLGDAPPHDPEPVSGYTFLNVVDAAFAVDPAQVYVLDVSTGGVRRRGSADRPAHRRRHLLGDVALTGRSGAHDRSTRAEEALRLGGRALRDSDGTPVVLDAAGSFDADGTIVSYEWDVDGDGVFDTSSSEPTFTHTYNSTFSGTVASASPTTTATRASRRRRRRVARGDEVPDAADNCPAVSNHGQSDSTQTASATSATPRRSARRRRPVRRWSPPGRAIRSRSWRTAPSGVGDGSSGQLGTGEVRARRRSP